MIAPLLTVLTPSKSEGQQWADDELSNPAYRDADLTLLERIGRAINRFLSNLFDTAIDFNNPWLIIVFALVVAAIVGFFVWRANRGTGDAFSPALFDRSELDGLENPEEYRKRAAQAAQRGDWNLAVVETVRASMAHLAHTRTVDLTASATAHELALAAGEKLPELSADLIEASDLFDAVSFGQFEATEDHYTYVSDIDSRVRSARVEVSA